MLTWAILLLIVSMNMIMRSKLSPRWFCSLTHWSFYTKYTKRLYNCTKKLV